MVSYKDGKKKRMTMVLSKKDNIIATFGNLKKVVEHLESMVDVDAPSYWTLARKDFPIEVGEYKISKVKHH